MNDTCRQLEAIVRISESLAKMRLEPFATESDVDEALRLFQVSTLDAAMSGSLTGGLNITFYNCTLKKTTRFACVVYYIFDYHLLQNFIQMNSISANPIILITLLGAEGFTTEEDQEMLSRIEKQLKKRFAIGSQVSEHAIVQDFLRQVIQFYFMMFCI